MTPINWSCAKCSAWARTVDDKLPHHPCPGMAGLMVPLVREGVKAKLIVNEREDFIKRELVQYDANGRPVMSVTTVTDEGESCSVFAPTVNVNVRD